MSRPTGAVLSDRSIRDAVATRLLVVEPFTPAYVQPSSLDLTLGGTEPLVLKRGVFTLAATAERLCLPPCIQGQVHGRSSIGRLGVLVHFTAGLIDPGFDGKITLEVMALTGPGRIRYWLNRQIAWFLRRPTFGEQPVEIWPTDRLAQISFHWLDQSAEQSYNGRYQYQKGPVASLFLHAREEEITDASR